MKEMFDKAVDVMEAGVTEVRDYVGSVIVGAAPAFAVMTPVSLTYGGFYSIADGLGINGLGSHVTGAVGTCLVGGVVLAGTVISGVVGAGVTAAVSEMIPDRLKPEIKGLPVAAGILLGTAGAINMASNLASSDDEPIESRMLRQDSDAAALSSDHIQVVEMNDGTYAAFELTYG
tara:strand:- start:436 stop:960 length:525 start_codon:yes stop_codon:yes gene_type:complete